MSTNQQRPLRLEIAALEDLALLAELERDSYPADEAASAERLAYRLREAPRCNLIARSADGQLIGFVSATRAATDRLTERSMREHVADGHNLCIHSVVIDNSFRGVGLGRALMQGYLEHARSLEAVRWVSLICKAALRSFYQSVGFRLVGPSAVVHGSDPWFELQQPL